MEEGCWWTHMAPPTSVLKYFRARRDKQIMGLELLAISLGMGTFIEKLTGRRVVIHTDNKGSEVRPFACACAVNLSCLVVVVVAASRFGARPGPRAACTSSVVVCCAQPLRNLD